MSIISIIYFFVVMWGLGFTSSSFLKNADNFLERNLMRLGIGLGSFILLSIILNLLHIPLSWWVFLLIAAAYPAYWFSKNYSKLSFRFKLTKSNLAIFVVLGFFIFSLFMYAEGAFKYPWLEDDDPWFHAIGAKYISIEKTAFTPIPGEKVFGYVDPYPPSYDIIMGVMLQTNDSVNWTLKFFNALIISLGIIFFYFFANLFIGDRNKALFAAFVLTVIPSYLSHFIWSHSLVPTLYFPVFYSMLMISKDKRWVLPSSVLVAAVLMATPTQAVKFGFFLLIFLGIKMLVEKRFLLYETLSGFFGLLLSLLWWGHAALRWGGISAIASLTGGAKARDASGNVVSTVVQGPLDFIRNIFDPLSGSATRPYTFEDFFIAKSQNMINNPIGWGVFITILVAVAVVGMILLFRRYIKEEKWAIITLALFVYTFLGVNGARLPVGLFAFRFWMLLAIPASLLASEGAWILSSYSKKIGIGKVLLFAILVIGLLFTSGIQKYNVNTAYWFSSGLNPQQALQGEGLIWLSNLPKDNWFGHVHL